MKIKRHIMQVKQVANGQIKPCTFAYTLQMPLKNLKQ